MAEQRTDKSPTRSGAYFTVDQTLVDFYIGSSDEQTQINRRPVVYIVNDVLTNMIVGFNISFEESTC